MTEDAFLNAVVADPLADELHLVYADWLEDQGDVRGEFLRIVVRLEALAEQKAPLEMSAKLRRVREIGRLKKLLAQLRNGVPEKWALQLCRGRIEDCNMVGFGANCPGRWYRLGETENPAVRYCGHCMRYVRFCWSVGEVEQAHHSGHPVVKALAMVRA